jgi:glycerol-3-phosphate dehydrogenase
LAELGVEVAPGLHEAELRYLVQHEWASCADDILWRRSKLGLHYTEAQRQQVRDWLQQHPMNETTPEAAPCN